MKNGYHKQINPGSIAKVSLMTLVFVVFGAAQIFAQFPGPGNTLDFDGVDDYVSITQNGGLPIYNNGTGNAYTVEFWVKADSNQADSVIFSEANDGPNSPNDALPLFKLSTGLPDSGTGRLAVFIRRNDNTRCLDNVHSQTVVFDTTWHHVAWVDNNGTCFLYIDGVLDGKNFDYRNLRGTTTLTNSTIGAVSRIGTLGITDNFAGLIDELRIWRVAQTQTEIQDNMCKKLDPANETNLVAYYRFDHLAGTSTLDDLTSNDNDGTLTNMDPNSDWVTSGAPIGDASIADYSSPSSVLLSHPNGDNVTANNFSSTPTGVQVYRVDEAPNDPTPPVGLDHLDPLRYWGVFVVGGGTYDFVYNYAGHPGITNEPTLDLASRADNSATSWTYANLTPNTSANTLTLSGESGRGEYILGSENTDNPLPVQLASFEAKALHGGVQLNWVTHSEINNLGFEIWRSVNSSDNFQLLASHDTDERLKGAGNSNTTRQYNYTDKNVETEQTYYYQLWDVSFAGERTYLKTVEVEAVASLAEGFELLQNYPNPFNAETVIRFQLPVREESAMPVSLNIFDPLGRKIRTLVNGHLSTGQEHQARWDGRDDTGNIVASGVYVYTLQAGGAVTSKKLLMIR